ncbi:hypothetical protein L1887_04832 [Cichorium endivia]|nr:hypothetical protein L1887_04832 [Cichorium endivia]
MAQEDLIGRWLVVWPLSSFKGWAKLDGNTSQFELFIMVVLCRDHGEKRRSIKHTVTSSSTIVTASVQISLLIMQFWLVVVTMVVGLMEDVDPRELVEFTNIPCLIWTDMFLLRGALKVDL